MVEDIAQSRHNLGCLRRARRFAILGLKPEGLPDALSHAGQLALQSPST